MVNIHCLGAILAAWINIYACKSNNYERKSKSLLYKKIKIKIYRTIILPVVLYRCETWSLTLREEQRLRVFENRVLRRIFGPKRDEVTGGWRKLHNNELSDLHSFTKYYSSDQIEKNEMGGACSRYGGEGRCLRCFGGET